MKNTVNWGVLGCAGIAEKAVIPAILQAQNARLYAVASRDGQKRERFSALFRPEKAYGSYEQMLKDPEVDAVYIPLPNALHCHWTVEASRHKKHVLCEKPLAMNAGEVERIRGAARQHGVAVMEAFAYLHGPLMEQVREIIAGGALGEIRYMESNFSFLLNDRDNIRLIPEMGGGAAWDLGCYPISFFRAVTGEEPDSIAHLTTVGKDSGVDEDTLLTLTFPCGAKAASHFSFRTHPCVRNTILGERGQLDIPSIFDRGTEKQSIRLITADSRREIKVERAGNYTLQVEQMGRVVCQGESPRVSLEFSLGNARVIDEIRKGASSHALPV